MFLTFTTEVINILVRVFTPQRAKFQEYQCSTDRRDSNKRSNLQRKNTKITQRNKLEFKIFSQVMQMYANLEKEDCNFACFLSLDVKIGFTL
jgi:hypothetical protein